VDSAQIFAESTRLELSRLIGLALWLGGKVNARSGLAGVALM